MVRPACAANAVQTRLTPYAKLIRVNRIAEPEALNIVAVELWPRWRVLAGLLFLLLRYAITDYSALFDKRY